MKTTYSEPQNTNYSTPVLKLIEVRASCIICDSGNISDDDNNNGNIGNMPWDD